MKAISDKNYAELPRHPYYNRQEQKAFNVIEHFWFATQVTVIICSLVSIYMSFKDLWTSI